MDGAASQLDRAFAGRAEGAETDRPRIGVFGDGLPGCLIRAAGAEPLDIRPAPERCPEVAAVTALAETFLDPATIALLHRLAAGAFDGFAGLVFCSADPAAQIAYQYAREMRRLGDLPEGPPLHLWNMVHSDSAAAEVFNAQEGARLDALLSATLGQGLPADLSGSSRKNAPAAPRWTGWTLPASTRRWRCAGATPAAGCRR